VNDVTGEGRKLHNEELNYLYSPPIIVQMIKSRRMRWAGHVAYMGEGEWYTGFWWGNLREKDHLENPGIDGGIILRWMIIRKWNVGGMDWIDLAEVRDRQQALVNAVMNLKVP
jgi:hypothetical protein